MGPNGCLKQRMSNSVTMVINKGKLMYCIGKLSKRLRLDYIKRIYRLGFHRWFSFKHISFNVITSTSKALSFVT